MNVTIKRTDASNPDFKKLVDELNAYLAKIDGEEHAFYAQFNNIDVLKHVVVAYGNDRALACGGMKAYNERSMEIKRMFTTVASRGVGLGKQILNELETWAKELGYDTCVLETGARQPDAVALYTKMGYKRTENYGQYKGIENSKCFKKSLLC